MVSKKNGKTCKNEKRQKYWKMVAEEWEKTFETKKKKTWHQTENKKVKSKEKQRVSIHEMQIKMAAFFKNRLYNYGTQMSLDYGMNY